MTDLTDLPRRRPHVSQPGEPLFLPRDPILLMANFGTFGRDAKLPGHVLRVSPCVSVPMVESGYQLVYSPVNPEMLYHPLFWIPKRLRMRAGETLDHWMIRVALEYTATGAYDPVDGTWYDVMAHLGISVDTREGRDRIQAWINGGEDKTLSDFDFDELLLAGNEDDHDWSYDAVTQMQPDLQVAAIHYTATSLADFMRQVCDPEDDYFTEHADGRSYSAALAARAASSFLDIIETDYDVDFMAVCKDLEMMDDDEIVADDSLARRLHAGLVRIADDSAEAEERLAESFSEFFGTDNPSAEQVEAALDEDEFDDSDEEDDDVESDEDEHRLAQ